MALTTYSRPLARLRDEIFRTVAPEPVPGVESAYDQLKPAERIFVDAFVAIDDPRRAAKEAYPAISDSVANVRAFDLMSRPLVKAAIAERYKRITDRFAITAENVTQEIALLAFARMGDYKQFGITADLDDLTSEQSAAISEMTVKEYKEGRGEEGRPVREFKFKLHDKGGALDKLAKIVGAYAPERLELTGANGGPVRTANVTVNMTPEEAAEAYQLSLGDE